MTINRTSQKKREKFQLTRSRGAWPHQTKVCHFIILFQLTRSRGAWPFITLEYYKAIEISTHTLTWSVTKTPVNLVTPVGFQLTRSRGAWLNLRFRMWMTTWFQLTRSRGAWPARTTRRPSVMLISTHTLTWSVTTLHRNHSPFINNFNSHAHVERDLYP